MIERHADRELTGKSLAEMQQRSFQSLHRLHGFGEDQNAEAERKAVLQHADNVGVHKRLAAREPDLNRWGGQAHSLAQKPLNVPTSQIDEAVVLGRGFDIAVVAGDIAKRARVEPKGLVAPE